MRHIFLSFLALAATLIYLTGLNADVFQDEPPATAELTATPPPASPQVLSPRPDQALQGNVPIVVITAVEGLQTIELSFSYIQDPTQTWFPLYQGGQALENQAILEWDTGQITDGDYTLRLVVTLIDSSQQTVLVPGLRVRNYTPIETDTPEPIPPTATSAPQDTPSPKSTLPPTQMPLPPTSTPLQSNPAELTRLDVYASARKGILAAVGLFALGLLYVSMRSKFRRR
jgi:hypothetical protein